MFREHVPAEYLKIREKYIKLEAYKRMNMKEENDWGHPITIKCIIRPEDSCYYFGKFGNTFTGKGKKFVSKLYFEGEFISGMLQGKGICIYYSTSPKTKN